MSRLNKILIFIFIVLLLIAVGEVVYYFYYQSAFKTKSPQTTSIDKSPSNSKTQFEQEEIALYQALNKIARHYRNLKRKGLLLSSTMTNKMGGELVEFTQQDGILPAMNFKYKLKITLQKNQESRSTYLNEKQMELIKVVNRIKGKDDVPMRLSDLKIHDKVVIIKVTNTLDPGSIIEFKIIKYD